MPAVPSQDLAERRPEQGKDYSTFRQGAILLPLQPDEGGALPAWGPQAALFRDADPARYHVADFLVWWLNFMIGDRLADASKKAGAPTGQAVRSFSSVDPGPFLSAGTIASQRFPLLALYRKRSGSKYVSTVWASRVSLWDARYVLPAMNLDQAEKIEPVLRAVEAAIDSACEEMWHPSYAPPGGRAGDQQWGLERAGVQEIESGESSWDAIPDSVGPDVYLALTISLEIKERRMPIRASDPGGPTKFTGADFDQRIAADGSDPAPAPLNVIRTDVPEE